VSADLRFAAMGTRCLIVCEPDEADLPEAGARAVDRLEQRWSRFLASSELSALNRSAGRGPFRLSPSTFGLVSMAIDAWRLTAGRFDPTVLTALTGAGYDEPYAELHTVKPPPHGAPTPGPVGIELDAEQLTVSLPEGVGLDLGGIGKGRAADLVAASLHERGATGVCVDLGGDVAVAGRPAHGGPWSIGIGAPDGTLVRTVALDSGGVATSCTAGRQWQTAEGPAHHLIDPATGRPSTSGVASVTVLAAEAAWAEVLAKAALIAGPDLGPPLVADAGACGLMITDDGELAELGDIWRFAA
jgi:FAD:protein FMN transferase